jgi:signal transduction histidine kinase/ligand-binding sensor domain-containing protein
VLREVRQELGRVFILRRAQGRLLGLLIAVLLMATACCALPISASFRPTVPPPASLRTEPAGTPVEPLYPRPSSEQGQAGDALPSQRVPYRDVRFEHISVEHGLSQSTVTCILQDSIGFLWFGTQDGLNRYDGSGFKVYRHDPQNPNSLSDNRVTALVEDQEGMLWIATDGGGLNQYDRETDTFTHYRHNPRDRTSVASNSVGSLSIDRDGMLWIGTGWGLDRLDRRTGQLVHYQPDPNDPLSLGGWTIETIHQDREGMLWIGTNGNGLDRFDPHTERFTHFQHDPNDPHSLISNYLIAAIYKDRRGDLWIGTLDGLDRLDRQTGDFVHYQHDPNDAGSLSNNTVISLYEDREEVLWIGTLGSGLDRFDRETERFTHYRNSPRDTHSLSSNIVRSIYEDQMGVLWIGTLGGGINRVDPLARRFTHYQNDPESPISLSNNLVRSILEDRNGVLWIGTFGGGLDRFDRETNVWRNYRNAPDAPSSLSNNNVSSICEDRSGVLWIGTLGGGFNRLDPQTERFTHYIRGPDDPNSLGNPFVYSILQDQEGMLWIATDEGPNGGLHRFDPQTERFTHYKHNPSDPHSLSDNWVRVLYEDRSGVLWIGTRNAGLNRYDRPTERFYRYRNDPRNADSLSHDGVSSIHEDQEGVLWVGTSGGGLNELDREQEIFTHYSVKDGLPSDAIYGILEQVDPVDTAGGHLWISTDNGLSKFDPRTGTFTNYDVSDGLQSNQFIARAYYGSTSGEMFFGGVNGFNAFYPQRVKDNPHIPPVVLTSLRQNGEDVKLPSAVESVEEVTFHRPDSTFEFEFAALSFIQPHKNQHAYMLEGFDRDWNDIGTLRYGKYTNLPGGTYTLRMKGSNNDGVWNEEGASVTITIVPPFWETWWFRGMIGLVLVGSVLGAYRLRVRSIEARSHELEAQVEQRTAELRQEIEQRMQVEQALQQSEREKAVVAERDRLARELHDSVTQSLYGVTLYADAAARQLDTGQVPTATDNLRKLRRTAKEALGEMRLLIFELRPPILEHEGLVPALETRLEAVERRSGLETKLNVDGEGRLPPDVEEGLYRIALEALNNALRHAQARSVTISLRLGPQAAVLQIADDGVGFDLAAAQESGGLGLRGMEERAEQLGGLLTVKSEPGIGTTVQVQVEVCQ